MCRHMRLTCGGTCAQVRLALDGRHIPKHLLNETPNPPSLKITYSQHTDLNVKFQSHRSRSAMMQWQFHPFQIQ
jgi:polypyrimidine tract-binding protein 2